MSSTNVRVLAVIVRYRMPVEESATLNSLNSALELDPALRERYTFLLWDNSPEPLLSPPAGMLYRHDPTNSGIAGAFNASAEYAREHDYTWMLMLDQDSQLPSAFLDSMARWVITLDAQADVAAITPTVLVGDYIASPRRMLCNRHVAYPRGEVGIAPGEAAGINSGTLLRVRDLLAVGGYSPAFQQEYSDWYVFHQLFLAGKKVWRAADVEFQHVMTVMDYDNLMSEARYGELLSAEEAFNDLYKGRLENSLQTFRLLMRAAKQRIKFQNPRFSAMTLQRFFRRLVTSRKYRIAIWQANSEARRKRYEEGSVS